MVNVPVPSIELTASSRTADHPLLFIVLLLTTLIVSPLISDRIAYALLLGGVIVEFSRRSILVTGLAYRTRYSRDNG